MQWPIEFIRFYKWNMRQFRDIEGQWPTINSEVNIYSEIHMHNLSME